MSNWFEIPFGVKIVNPKPVDARRWNNNDEPYANVAEVLAQNPPEIRHINQEYDVHDGAGGIAMYYFNGGIADEDLVEILRIDPDELINIYGGQSIGGTLTVLVLKTQKETPDEDDDVVPFLYAQENYVNLTGNQTIDGKLTTKGHDIINASNEVIASIRETATPDFGAAVGGVNDDGNPVNFGLAGSNLFEFNNTKYIRSDSAIPNGFLKLSETPTVIDGDDYYPLSFQTLVTEIASETFTDNTNTVLATSYQTILTSTALANTYRPPSNAAWKFKVSSTGNKSVVITYRFLSDGAPVGDPKQATIGTGQVVVINGEADITNEISAGRVITLEVLVDTVTGVTTTVIGAEESTTLKITQLSNTLGVPPSIAVAGASITTSQGDLFAVVTSAGTYTLPLLSSLAKLNFGFKIKNLSGGDITVSTSGSDTFDTGAIAETSIVVPYGYTLDLFVHSSGYLITQNV